MPKISFKISESLHHQVLLTMQGMGFENVSDTVRFLLHSALENQALDTGNTPQNKLQKKARNYTIMAYCLIEKFLSTAVKNGQTLSNKAHDKAEKLINSLAQRNHLSG